ncbi:MAG TPA: CHAD domain-containing protein [Solirubrobacterales bacterium]|nr:CHAD domain-containing protein [Solirubrobacterales bacterium]
MSRGTERKFLLAKAPAWLAGRPGELIEQAYLVRVRRRVSAGGGLQAEVDVYEGEFEGLVVATVRFDSEEAAREFQPPGWLGREVTGEGGYPEPDAPRASRAYRLERKEGVAEGLRRIAGGRADHALAQLRSAAGGDLAAAVHAARKDMKKLRAVLRLVRAELGEDVYRAENERYRDASRLLSHSRDAEVKLATLTALGECFGAELPAEPARSWREELEAERDEVVSASGGEVGARIEQAVAAIAAGREEIAGWPIEGSWKLVGRGLKRGYRQGRRELKRTRSEPGAEQVHQWRKRVKDHWYQLRVLAPAWPDLLGESARQAHRLAELLGDHHDLAVLAEDLADRSGLERREELAAAIERRQGELLAEAFALGARLYAEKPSAFERRLRAYWKAWR